MRSKSVSPLGTLLTIVAVLAVPLLAVFGIPQFVPVVASSSSSPQGAPLDATPRPASPSELQSSAPPLSGRDIFASIPEPAVSAVRPTASLPQYCTPVIEAVARPPRPPAPAGAENTQSPQSPAPLPIGWTTGGPPKPVVTEVARSRSENFQPLTWKTAVTRLNGLGIKQFQLQPGQKPGTFHFRCYLAGVADSRVSVRFESEADEPLEAVREVLDQVAQWYQTR